MPAVRTPQRGISHGRHPAGPVRVAVLEELYMGGGRLDVLVVAVRGRECGPARVSHSTALGTAPTEIGPVDIVIEQALRLIPVHDGLHIRPHPAGVVRPSVKPYHEKVSVSGAQLRHHALTVTAVPLLAVGGELAFSLRLEIMYPQKGIPPYAHIYTGLDAVFAA